MPGPTSLPRGGDINGLLYAGERGGGPNGPPGRRRKGRKREEGWGFVGCLRQGVRIQDALGVRDQHLVPRWVRGRADQDPVANDDGRASVPDELGLVRVPVRRRQRREGDVEIGRASCRERG